MKEEACVNNQDILDIPGVQCISPEEVWCCKWVDWLVSFFLFFPLASLVIKIPLMVFF